MVLYEDLRIYTIWRTDLARSKQEASDYKKSAEEWEILGELAERLHHFPEAVEAYQACLRMRFSPKAMKGVLKMFEKEGKYGEMLQALIRLIAWQYRWYSEVRIILLSMMHPVPTANSSVAVFSSAPAYGAEADRRGGCGQGAEHCASHELTAAGTGPHPSLCTTLCDISK